MALVVVLTGVLFVLVNPTQQLQKGRNQARRAHLQIILGAVGQNIADNRGTFNCATGALPTSTKKLAIGGGNYDIAGCLVPAYLPNLPFDPFAAGAHYASNADYDTGYYIIQSATTSRVTATAPSAELGDAITYTR
ncbi:MAG: hypothetical protein HY978_02155 [Candidatus Liptonbacteria bacterium]|nr:hypothetical protein [Candidatus Liptonbacteria bacterium]